MPNLISCEDQLFVDVDGRIQCLKPDNSVGSWVVVSSDDIKNMDRLTSEDYDVLSSGFILFFMIAAGYAVLKSVFIPTK